MSGVKVVDSGPMLVCDREEDCRRKLGHPGRCMDELGREIGFVRGIRDRTELTLNEVFGAPPPEADALAALEELAGRVIGAASDSTEQSRHLRLYSLVRDALVLLEHREEDIDEAIRYMHDELGIDTFQHGPLRALHGGPR